MDLSENAVCGNKAKCRTKAEANEFRYKHPDRMLMESYQCPYCGFWHIGHSENRVIYKTMKNFKRGKFGNWKEGKL